MKLSDFDFDLPDALTATRPARPRSSARLLVAGPTAQQDMIVTDLPKMLLPGDQLILNDTKVIPARLSGKRHRDSAQGAVTARIEVTLIELTAGGHWQALLKPLKKVRDGEIIEFLDGFHAKVMGRKDGVAELSFNLTGAAFDAALAEAGAMPLPPYIAAKRPADEADREDYQTVWAANPGAVAAPTASLHFDDGLMAALKTRGVEFTHVTLHVGAGTFLPVKTDDVSEHKMHAEWGEISEQAAQEMNETRENGGRIIPVGTTALRLIETAGRENGTIRPWRGDTDIFITPGYQFKMADALITNFHLPRSSLLVLVATFHGHARTMATYEHAVRNGLRFYFYGDVMVILPERT